METIEQYLDKTESSIQLLIQGMDGYIQILRRVPMPVFVGSSENEAEFLEQYEAWQASNANQIQARKEVEDAYIAESFALANLCGAMLQMASMGIKMFGQEGNIPPSFNGLIQEKWGDTRKYCSGREIGGVPIGLIIYAGRNQYNHYDDRPKLKNPAKKVFELLSDLGVDDQGLARVHPGYDLKNERIICFASNIISLLEWNTYDAYRKDILEIVNFQKNGNGE